MPLADAHRQRDKKPDFHLFAHTDGCAQRLHRTPSTQRHGNRRRPSPPGFHHIMQLESFMPMNAEISQDVLARLLIESVGSPDLRDDKLVDKSSNLLSLSCVYTSCHNCQGG
jgi:hypothetical protein